MPALRGVHHAGGEGLPVLSAGVGMTIFTFSIIMALAFCIFAFCIWWHISEYPRRRKLTPEQRAEEDRLMKDRLPHA